MKIKQITYQLMDSVQENVVEPNNSNFKVKLSSKNKKNM